MNKMILILSIAVGLYACSGNAPKKEATADQTATTTENGNPSYDPERGTGKFTNVTVSPTLDNALATAGQKVYDVKCSSCHKLTEEKLVGPGWKDVTKRHKPEWILNFVTNTDEMLQKDSKAQAMLEICLVRMPNQNLTDEEARNAYEFMRKNDGVK
ncbi:cytochrome C [Niastella vici]|uniref:Cytochrome C n=1 Tax=Niastella vici TaxID=1703345 RepID=A0A1V9G169_9BACT|nr:cytochrome c [Niastella vici]OQP64332.1 cytochrome C [Niastella vici]